MRGARTAAGLLPVGRCGAQCRAGAAGGGASTPFIAAPAPPFCRSFIEQPPNTVQTFLDLNAELAAAFGGADGGAGQLLTPDGLRGMVGAEEGADLAALLRQPPGGPW